MWVARNKDSNGDGGRLFLFFKEKPTRHIYYNTWTVLGGNYDNMGGFPVEYGVEIDKTLFPKLTWKDEPIEVELTPIEKQIGEEIVDEIDTYTKYLESLNDDFALELRSLMYYCIRDKFKSGQWKTFDEKNLAEIKDFLIMCIYNDYSMMKAYFPKECKRKIDMKYIDKWFNFAKYELNGIDNEK